jgi:hypothetical protein
MKATAKLQSLVRACGWRTSLERCSTRVSRSSTATSLDPSYVASRISVLTSANSWRTFCWSWRVAAADLAYQIA